MTDFSSAPLRLCVLQSGCGGEAAAEPEAEGEAEDEVRAEGEKEKRAVEFQAEELRVGRDEEHGFDEERPADRAGGDEARGGAGGEAEEHDAEGRAVGKVVGPAGEVDEPRGAAAVEDEGAEFWEDGKKRCAVEHEGQAVKVIRPGGDEAGERAFGDPGVWVAQ